MWQPGSPTRDVDLDVDRRRFDPDDGGRGDASEHASIALSESDASAERADLGGRAVAWLAGFWSHRPAFGRCVAAEWQRKATLPRPGQRTQRVYAVGNVFQVAEAAFQPVKPSQ